MEYIVVLCSVFALVYGDVNAMAAAFDPSRSESIMSQEFNPSLFSKNIEEVRAAVARGDDVNMDNHRCGTTPLTCAADKSRLDVVKYLLVEAKADPNKMDIDGFLPLTFAVIRRNVITAELLIKFKADPYLKDKNEISPMDLALYLCEEAKNEEEKSNLLEIIRIFEDRDFASGISFDQGALR